MRRALRRLLLLPHVIRLGCRAPRDAAWERYWSAIGATGDDGDVLWDSSSSGEGERYRELLVAHADAALPVVDLGCGNGRITRAVAGHFPRVLGVDLSEAAIERARTESDGVEGVEFRAVDLLADGSADALAAELGECHVVVRGVLHVLDTVERRRLGALAARLVGRRGTVLVAETNHPGPLLGYLENLGGGPRGLPRQLAGAIAGGLPRPRPFGRAELQDCFPPARWESVLVDDAAVIATVPLQRAGTGAPVPGRVPGLVALLRPRTPRDQDCPDPA